MKTSAEELTKYFVTFEERKPEELTEIIEKYLTDDAVEAFVDHIEEFYGVADDEELGHLAQLMITGFIAAKEMSK